MSATENGRRDNVDQTPFVVRKTKSVGNHHPPRVESRGTTRRASLWPLRGFIRSSHGIFGNIRLRLYVNVVF